MVLDELWASYGGGGLYERWSAGGMMGQERELYNQKLRARPHENFFVESA